MATTALGLALAVRIFRTYGTLEEDEAAGVPAGAGQAGSGVDRGTS